MNFQKFQLKWKVVKKFHKSQTANPALRKLSSLPPTHLSADKILLPLWNKYFLADIYRNIQAFALKVLQECSSWASRNVPVQMFFLTPNRNIFAGEFERFLAVLREHIIFNVSWVEIRKMNEFFEPTCISYALRLSARKLELKKKLWWCPLECVDAYKKVACPK